MQCDSCRPSICRGVPFGAIVAIVVAITVAMSSGCQNAYVSAEKSFTWQFPVSQPIPVLVEGSNGSIEVLPSSDSEVHVEAFVTAYGMDEGDAESHLSDAVPTAEKLETEITVNANVKQGILRQPSVRFVLKVPNATPLKLRTSNGSIQVIDVPSSRIVAKTSNGGIEVKGVKEDVDLETSNGRIELENVTGVVKAKTSNGFIEGKIAVVGENSSLETSNGGIQVGLIEPESVAIEAATKNGTIECELPTVGEVKTEKTTFSGIVGTSAEVKARLTLRTSNGNILIKK